MLRCTYLKKSSMQNFQEIGKYFSGRDHTSVMHAVKKVKSSFKTDLALSRQVIEIENSL